MNKLKTQLIKLVAGLALMGAFVSNAVAGPIVGSVSWSGAIDSGGASLATLTYLDFLPVSGVSPTPVNGLGATGDYTGAAFCGGCIDVYDIADFASHLPGPANFPDQIAFDVDTGTTVFRFTLESLSIGLQNSFDLDLDGTGTVRYLSGADDSGVPWVDTSFLWAFSAQQAGGSSQANYSFSADAISPIPPIPEPGMLSLLGIGLLGLGLTSRRRRVAS